MGEFFGNDTARIIVRCIIDDEYFYVLVSLRMHALQAFDQGIDAVAGDDDDAY